MKRERDNETIHDQVLELVPKRLEICVPVAVGNLRDRKVLTYDMYKPVAMYGIHSVLAQGSGKPGRRNVWSRSLNTIVGRLERYGLAQKLDPKTNHPMLSLGGGLIAAIMVAPDVDHGLDSKGGYDLEEVIHVVCQLFPGYCDFNRALYYKRGDAQALVILEQYQSIVTAQLEAALH